MNATPYISVICPTFNASKHIRGLLESLCRQTYKNFEVIILDNLSSDETLQVCELFAPLLNMKIHVKSDKGIYDAYNNGIALAAGTFLYFIGADDSIIDDEVFSKLTQKESVHIIYGNVKVEDRVLHGKIDSSYLSKHNFPHQAAFFRKDIFGIIGLYNTRYIIEADYAFMLKAFNTKEIKIEYIDSVIAQYGHEGFSSQKKDINFALDSKNIFRESFKEDVVKVPSRYFLNLLEAGHTKQALNLIPASELNFKKIVKAMIILCKNAYRKI